MKIVDLDCLRDDRKRIAAARWLRASFMLSGSNGETKLIPCEAMYFFSTTASAEDAAKTVGLWRKEFNAENYWEGRSLFSLLQRMIAGLNRFRIEHSMPTIRQFDGRVPVVVVSDRDLADIEACGAVALPIDLLEAMN